MSSLRHLPSPDGFDHDGMPWWRLCSGERIYGIDGSVYGPSLERPVDLVEQDSMAYLAACAYARGSRT